MRGDRTKPARLRIRPPAALGPTALGSVTPGVVARWWSRLPADQPTVRARSHALLRAAMKSVRGPLEATDPLCVPHVRQAPDRLDGVLAQVTERQPR